MFYVNGHGQKDELYYSSYKAITVDELAATLQKASDNKEDIDWERIIDSFKVGMKVKHNNFGEGEVVWVDSSKKYFRVKFTGGEKPFVFPNAFEQGYLTL